MFPVTHFFRGMTRPVSWSYEVRCSSYLQFHVVASHLSYLLIFSRTGGRLSRLNSSTHRPWCTLKNLCFQATIVVSSLVFAATNVAFIIVFIPRIGRSEADRVCCHAPRIPLTSFGTFLLRTLCTAGCFATLFVPLQLLVYPLGSCF